MKFLRSFLKDENAATAIEYAVLVALLIVVMMSTIALVGGENAKTWSHNSDKISSAMGS